MTDSEKTCDVFVVGSGAGGVSAPISASLALANVIMAEKEPVFGAATARSGGWCWIPLPPKAIAASVEDSDDCILTYLRHKLGDNLDERKVRAFLTSGPEMFEHYEKRTSVRLELETARHDYHPEAPGGRTGGQALSTSPFDAREMGSLLPFLAPPLRALMLGGMSIGSSTEFREFIRATRSLRFTWFVAKRDPHGGAQSCRPHHIRPSTLLRLHRRSRCSNS